MLKAFRETFSVGLLNWNSFPYVHQVCVCVPVLNRVRHLVTPRIVACQFPLSVGFSWPEYCSGLLFPSPGDLPEPGTKLMSPYTAGGFSTTEPPGKPIYIRCCSLSLQKAAVETAAYLLHGQ